MTDLIWIGVALLAVILAVLATAIAVAALADRRIERHRAQAWDEFESVAETYHGRDRKDAA